MKRGSGSAASPHRGKATVTTLTYSGSGNKNLGQVSIPGNATLRWTNDGGRFSMEDVQQGPFVDSSAHAGSTSVTAGTYTSVSVHAVGNWKVVIVTKAP
jgi:hypothetical protein